MTRNIRKASWVAATLLILAAVAAAAESATMTFTKPMNTPQTVKIKIKVGSTTEEVSANLPANCSAETKAELLKDALVAKGYTVDYTANTNHFTIQHLTNGTVVTFDPAKTGEKKDDVVGDNVAEAKVKMDNAIGYYDPYDPDGEPATFGAGVITELGECWVELSAEDLEFDTTPEHICWSLFEQLQPLAWEYGAEIACTDDSMEFYFDPAVAGEHAGVSFGTTSPSEGFRGEVQLGDESCPGDIDGDGDVDLGDLAGMLAAYGTAEGDAGYDPAADLDGDGSIGLSDLAALLSVYGTICE